MNAAVKAVTEEVRAALLRASRAARIGGLKDHQFLEILRENSTAVVTEERANKKRIRQQLIEHRDVAPKQIAPALKAAIAAHETAKAKAEKAEAALEEARAACGEALSARIAREAEARGLVDAINMLLEQTADPVIDEFTRQLEKEFAKARVRPFPTRPDRFSPKSEAAKRNTVQDDWGRQKAAPLLTEPARDPRRLTVVPIEDHQQITAYMTGLMDASRQAESLKLTALEDTELLVELEAIESRIPNRDEPDIVRRIREAIAQPTPRGRL